MTLPKNTKFATFPQRLSAFNIDFLVFLVLMVPLSFIVKDDLVFWSLFFCVICIYHAVFESSPWQGTLGKKYSHIQVVDQQGNRLTFLHCLLRIVTKYLSLLLFFIGFFMIYLRRDRRGLHDILSNTYVVDRGYLDREIGKSHN